MGVNKVLSFNEYLAHLLWVMHGELRMTMTDQNALDHLRHTRNYINGMFEDSHMREKNKPFMEWMKVEYDQYLRREMPAWFDEVEQTVRQVVEGEIGQ